MTNPDPHGLFEAAYSEVSGGKRAVEPKRRRAGVEALDTYDAGLLADYGGGDVGWWHDYIRAELDRAHDFYQSQIGVIDFGKGMERENEDQR